MKVFYESKLAKWLLWQGYNTITLGWCCNQEKQGGDEAEYT